MPDILPIDDRKKKNKMISTDRAEFLYKVGLVWKLTNHNTEVVYAIVKHDIEPSVLFDNYYDKILPAIEMKRLVIVREDEVQLHHLESVFVDFTN